MADAALILERRGALAGHRAAAVAPLSPAVRFSFRGAEPAVEALGQAFGCLPSRDACRAVSEGDRAALWLGPDEWMLIAQHDAAASLLDDLEAALRDEPHSLVDISHRNTGFDIVGETAWEILSEGCPLDFDETAFPVGMCTRTVLAKAEVVLWRQASDRFRLECWRSFAPYVLAFLNQAVENQD